MPLYARLALAPRQTGPPWLPPAPRFTAIPGCYPAALCPIHRKTSNNMANRNSNPIDPPASTAPAAHFKRLYRNCPAVPATPLTPARGSHDRVLTFQGNSFRAAASHGSEKPIRTGDDRLGDTGVEAHHELGLSGGSPDYLIANKEAGLLGDRKACACPSQRARTLRCDHHD
jgi:hypothetical protein